MAEFKTIVPVLKVADLQRAVDFYTSVLGFTVCWHAANDGGGENCMLVIDPFGNRIRFNEDLKTGKAT
jgi:hypothetical protein